MGVAAAGGVRHGECGCACGAACGYGIGAACVGNGDLGIHAGGRVAGDGVVAVCGVLAGVYRQNPTAGHSQTGKACGGRSVEDDLRLRPYLDRDHALKNMAAIGGVGHGEADRAEQIVCIHLPGACGRSVGVVGRADRALGGNRRGRDGIRAAGAHDGGDQRGSGGTEIGGASERVVGLPQPYRADRHIRAGDRPRAVCGVRGCVHSDLAAVGLQAQRALGRRSEDDGGTAYDIEVVTACVGVAAGGDVGDVKRGVASGDRREQEEAAAARPDARHRDGGGIYAGGLAAGYGIVAVGRLRCGVEEVWPVLGNKPAEYFSDADAAVGADVYGEGACGGVSACGGEHHAEGGVALQGWREGVYRVYGEGAGVRSRASGDRHPVGVHASGVGAGDGVGRVLCYVIQSVDRQGEVAADREIGRGEDDVGWVSLAGDRAVAVGYGVAHEGYAGSQGCGERAGELVVADGQGC